MNVSLYTPNERELQTKVLNCINKYVGRKKGTETWIKTGAQHIYWGITIDYNIDIKIIFILNKLVEMANLGNKITILIADIHSLLERQKPISSLEIDRFEKTINTIIDAYQLDPLVRKRFHIIKGSEFQLSPTYILDFYKLISINGTIDDYCKHFHLDIKEIEFKDVINPILQTLDEAHLMKIADLEVDCQIGYTRCLEQYVFSKKNMKKLGFKSKTYLLYDIPDAIFKRKIYIDYSAEYLVPLLSICSEEVIDFVMKTMFDFANISNIIDKETMVSELDNFKTLSIPDRQDHLYKIVNGLYINHIRQNGS
jgi:hypothetical protein